MQLLKRAFSFCNSKTTETISYDLTPQLRQSPTSHITLTDFFSFNICNARVLRQWQSPFRAI